MMMQLLIWGRIHDWIHLPRWMEMNLYTARGGFNDSDRDVQGYCRGSKKWLHILCVCAASVCGQQMLLWTSLDTRVGEENTEGTAGPRRQNIKQTARSVTTMRHVQADRPSVRHDTDSHCLLDWSLPDALLWCWFSFFVVVIIEGHFIVGNSFYEDFFFVSVPSWSL